MNDNDLMWHQNERAAKYRGVYLQAVSHIEWILDATITEYFCPDDGNVQDEFIYSILASDKMTLSNKHQIFMFIAQRHCKEIYDYHYGPLPKKVQKAFPDYKTLGARMEIIISTRNKFAHRKFYLDSSMESVDSKIVFDTKTPRQGELIDSLFRVDDKEMGQLVKEVEIATGSIDLVSKRIKERIKERHQKATKKK